MPEFKESTYEQFRQDLSSRKTNYLLVYGCLNDERAWRFAREYFAKFETVFYCLLPYDDIKFWAIIG